MFETARLPLIQTAPRQIGHSDADGFRHLPKIAGVGAAYVLQSDGNGGAFWGPVSGASVASVFGRTGAVLAVAGDYDAFYYTKAQTTDLVNTRPALHRWPIDSNHGYAFTRSYNSATRQPTLTPTGSSFHAWMHGTKIEFATAQTLPAHPNVTGLYFYYLDTDLAFKYSTMTWNLLSIVPCVIIIYDATKGVGKMYHELHTTEMTGLEHEEQHTTIGTKIVDGGAILSGYTFNVDSDAAVTFGASACTLWDEDIRHLIAQLNDNGPYEIWYRSGASGSWTWDDPAAKPYKIGATYITFNRLVSTTWQQVEATGLALGSYVNIYVIPVPCDNGPQWMFVQGQNEFTTQAAAEAESWKSLALDGFPVQEFVSVRRVTYWARSTHTGVAGRVKMVSITDVETTRGGSSGSSTIHNTLAGREDANCHGFPAIGGTLLASQFPALSGDVSTVAGSLTATLASIVIAGSAGSASVVPIPTWDAKGRITSVTTATITPSAIGALPASGGTTNRVAKWTSSTTLGSGIITDDGDFVFADPGAATGGRFKSRYAGSKAQLVGNSNAVNWWGVGTDGTTADMVRIGRTTSDGVFVADGFELSVLGNLRLPGCLFRDDVWSSDGYAIYASGVTPNNTNASLYLSKNGALTAINGSGSSSLSVDGVAVATAYASGLSIPSLAAGGMLRAAAGGLLQIAAASDLPGGPYLPLTAGSSKVISGTLYLNNGVQCIGQGLFDDLLVNRESTFYGDIAQPGRAGHRSAQLLDVTADSLAFAAAGNGGIKGRTNASDAEDGDVGEYVSSSTSNAAPVSVTSSGTTVDVVSITLGPGDWDLSASNVFSGNISGTTRARAAISMASATVSSDGFEADGTISTVAGAKLTVSLQKRIAVAVSTTVYLCAVMTGTFGAASCWGNLSARRRR